MLACILKSIKHVKDAKDEAVDGVIEHLGCQAPHVGTIWHLIVIDQEGLRIGIAWSPKIIRCSVEIHNERKGEA